MLMARREGRPLYGHRLAIVGIALLLFSILSPTASAVEYGNIGGQPARPDPKNPRTTSIFIKYAAVGETVRDVVKVVNYTGETKTLQVYAVDSIVSSGGSFGCAQMVDEKKVVGSWVKMSKTEVTLEPNGEEEIPFTVTPKQGADVGENDGCIVIQEKDKAPEKVGGENSSINLSFRTAIRLAVFLPGEVKKSVEILGYAASRSPDGNYTLKPRARNNGNVSLDVTLNTYTKGILGGSVDNYNQESPLLRGVTSDWNIPYKKPFWGGWYTSKFTVTYDANVSNSLGESENPNLVTLHSKRIYFFVPPSLLALLIEIIILAILLFVAWRAYLRFIGGKRRTRDWKTIIISNPTDIETLARAYSISWKELAKVNRMRAPYLLRQGDRVKVPAGRPASAPARRGFHFPSLNIFKGRQDYRMWREITIANQTDIETLARAYGVSWKELAKKNNLRPPYILRPGDRVLVPDDQTSHYQGPQSGMGNGGHHSPPSHHSSHYSESSGLSRLLPFLERRRLSNEWDEITLKSQIDGIVSTPLDIESIAKSYGVPWKTLAKINKLKPPYNLRPGDRLKVPYKKQRY